MSQLYVKDRPQAVPLSGDLLSQVDACALLAAPSAVFQTHLLSSDNSTVSMYCYSWMCWAA
jgi:hypothetical protein